MDNQEPRISSREDIIKMLGEGAAIAPSLLASYPDIFDSWVRVEPTTVWEGSHGRKVSAVFSPGWSETALKFDRMIPDDLAKFHAKRLVRENPDTWSTRMFTVKTRPWEMTPEELRNWDFPTRQGGSSLTPKEAFGMVSGEDYTTLFDLSQHRDPFNFHYILGKQSTNTWPHSMHLISKIRKNQPIRVYRASDSGPIIPGSYVTESLPYAQDHLESILRGQGEIVTGLVLPSDLESLGDAHEFRFIPDLETYHRQVIKNAIKEGEEIPPEVLNEYPDLFQGDAQYKENYDEPIILTDGLESVYETHRVQLVQIQGVPDLKIKFASDIFDIISDMPDYNKEFLKALYFDSHLRLLGVTIISVGTESATVATPREVIRAALLFNAVGVVIVHNHPSGDPTPSLNDNSSFWQFTEAFKTSDLNLIDFMIIGKNGEYHSFKNKGTRG